MFDSDDERPGGFAAGGAPGRGGAGAGPLAEGRLATVRLSRLATSEEPAPAINSSIDTSLRRWIHRRERHLEVIARLCGAADVELRLRQQVEGAHQVLAREPLAQGEQPSRARFRRRSRDRWRGTGRPRAPANRGRHATTPGRPAVSRNPSPRPGPQSRTPRPHPRRPPPAACSEQIAAHQAEHRRHIVGPTSSAGERNHLIERALRVAHAAARPSRAMSCSDVVGHVDASQRRRSSAAGRRWPGADGPELEAPASATGRFQESCRARSWPS